MLYDKKQQNRKYKCSLLAIGQPESPAPGCDVIYVCVWGGETTCDKLIGLQAALLTADARNKIRELFV